MIQLTTLPHFHYQQLLFKTAFWAVAEIWLGFLGIDDLADYSEFLLGQDLTLAQKNNRTVESAKIHPVFCQKINDTCPVKATEIQLNSCSIENDYLYYYSTFKNKCVKVKAFCIKAELLSQLI